MWTDGARGVDTSPACGRDRTGPVDTGVAVEPTVDDRDAVTWLIHRVHSFHSP